MGKRTVKPGSCICIAALCGIAGILLLGYPYICGFLFAAGVIALAYLPLSIAKLRKHPLGRILFRVVDVLACGLLAITVFLGMDVLEINSGFFSEISARNALDLINRFLQQILLRFLNSLPL